MSSSVEPVKFPRIVIHPTAVDSKRFIQALNGAALGGLVAGWDWVVLSQSPDGGQAAASDVVDVLTRGGANNVQTARTTSGEVTGQLCTWLDQGDIIFTTRHSDVVSISNFRSSTGHFTLTQSFDLTTVLAFSTSSPLLTLLSALKSAKVRGVSLHTAVGLGAKISSILLAVDGSVGAEAASTVLDQVSDSLLEFDP